jgi:hypothetical protein
MEKIDERVAQARPRASKVDLTSYHENRDIPWLVLYIVHSLDSPDPHPDSIPNHALLPLVIEVPPKNPRD